MLFAVSLSGRAMTTGEPSSHASLTAASFFASACFTMLTLLIGIASRNPASLATRLAALKGSTE